MAHSADAMRGKASAWAYREAAKVYFAMAYAQLLREKAGPVSDWVDTFADELDRRRKASRKKGAN